MRTLSVDAELSGDSAMLKIFEEQVRQIMLIQFLEGFKWQEHKSFAQFIQDGQSQINAISAQASKKKGSKVKELDQRHLLKQIKMLLKNHESLTEMSLQQFIEFFCQSQCLLPQVDESFFLFLRACSSCCIVTEKGDQFVIKLKPKVLGDLLRDEVTIPQTKRNWQTELKKQLASASGAFQADMVTQLLDVFIAQSRGWKMDVLRQVRGSNAGANIKEVSVLEQTATRLFLKAEPEKENDPKQIENVHYFFSAGQILEAIAELIGNAGNNPVLIGQVLRHRDSKTFKYIVRNVLALQSLHLRDDFSIEFHKAEEDYRLEKFFKCMLLDRHTITPANKIYRQEARKVFVKELAKNLMDADVVSDDPSSNKLIFNYSAVLLLLQTCCTPEAKNDPSDRPPKLRAIDQAIRRYNKMQKQNLLLRLVFEMQVAGASGNRQSDVSGFTVCLLAQIKRIRDLAKKAGPLFARQNADIMSKCCRVLLAVLTREWQDKPAGQRAMQRIQDRGRAYSASQSDRDEADDVSLTVEDQLDIEELRGDDDDEDVEDEDDDLADEEGEDEGDIDADFDFLDDSGLYGDEEHGESENEEDDDPHALLDVDEEGEAELSALASDSFVDEIQSQSASARARRLRYDSIDNDADSGIDLPIRPELFFEDAERNQRNQRGWRSVFDNADALGLRPPGDSADDEENDDSMQDSYDEEVDAGYDDDDDEEEGFAANDRAQPGPFGDLAQMYGDVAMGDRDDRGAGVWAGPGDSYSRAGNGHHRDRSPSDYSDDAWSSGSSQSHGRRSSDDRSAHSDRSSAAELATTETWVTHDPPFMNTLMGRSCDKLVDGASTSGPPQLLWNPMPYRRHRESDFRPTYDISWLLKPVRDAVCAGTWPPAVEPSKKPDHASKLVYQLQALSKQLTEMLYRRVRVDKNLWIVHCTPEGERVRDQVQPDAKSALLDDKAEMGKGSPDNQKRADRSMLKGQLQLANVEALEEFERAIRILGGEEQPPPEEPASALPVAQEPSETEGQIDTSGMNKAALASTLDHLDPVFARALSAPALQSIKDQDQMFHKMAAPTGLALQKKTLNDFIKRQEPAVRKQILLSLEQHMLSHLTPDLFAEARRVRPAQGPREQRRPAPGGAGQAQGQQRARLNRPAPVQAREFRQVNKPEIKGEVLRDSESEDLTILVQRVNLDPDVFFLNMHKFMKDNIERYRELDIRDQLSNFSNLKLPDGKDSIKTNVDLENYISKLLSDQFEQADDPEQGHDEQKTGATSSSGKKQNAKQIIPILDIIVAELHGKRFRDGGVRDELRDYNSIIQLPDFRLGLIVKVTQAMRAEMKALQEHIKLISEKSAFFNSTKPFRFGKVLLETDEEEYLIAPSQAIADFLAYICELQQQLLFGDDYFKVRSQLKFGVLDLLKSPDSDPNLKVLFDQLSENDAIPQGMTLLDIILQVVVDYLVLLGSFPQAFEMSERNDREFDRWRFVIAQHVHQILQQVKVALIILQRKKEQIHDNAKIKAILKLNNLQHLSFRDETLDRFFAFLFFAEPTIASPSVQTLMENVAAIEQVDLQPKTSSKRTAHVLLRLLDLFAQLPIKSGQSDGNLLTLYEEENSQDKLLALKMDLVAADVDNKSLLYDLFVIVAKLQLADPSKNHAKVQEVMNNVGPANFFQISNLIDKSVVRRILNAKDSPDDNEGRLNTRLSFDLDRDTLEKLVNTSYDEFLEEVNQPSPSSQIVLKRVLAVLNAQLLQFEKFFDEKLNCNPSDTSVLGSLGKHEARRLTVNLERIVLVLDAAWRLESLSKNGNREQKGKPEHDFVTHLLGIVSRVIDVEKTQVTRSNKKSFLYRNDFKLILELVFTLASRELLSMQINKTQKDQASKKPHVAIDLKPAPVDTSEDDLAKAQKQFKESPVVSCVLQFLYANKTLLNDFITNTVNHSDSLLTLVSTLPSLLEFGSKRILWRHLVKRHLKKSARDDHDFEVDLQVRRDQVFSDSFEQLKDVSVASWKQRFLVEFHDEEGVDEGGLTREWFQLVSQGVFDPSYALFQQSAHSSTYFPSPRAGVIERNEMTAMFRFVGRIIGKALNEGHLLDCFFVRALYKMMLGQPLDMSDVEDFDQDIHKSLTYMLDNDATILCQNFMLSSKFFDEQRDVELKPGGKDIEVDNENKFEYIGLVIEHLLYKCVSEQIDAFLAGFNDMVPPNLIKIFDHHELELMISGLPTVDVSDLRENVIYKNYTNQSTVVQWLWEVLEEFKNSERAEFIQFVTGSSKVPVEGFAGLRATNGQPQKVEIIKLPAEKPDTRLPQAHTCFFSLDLPEYSSRDILREKLLIAIKEGKTFNIA